MMNFIRLSLALILVSGFAHAQLVKNNDTTFGPEAIRLDFRSFLPGADATGLFSKYGVRFSGRDSIATIIDLNGLIPVPPVLPDYGRYIGVTNKANSGSSSGLPFRIDFAIPPRQLGFSLRHPGLPASITAFDADGKSLGTVQQAAGSSQPSDVRLSVPSGQGISKVIIDFGESAIPEEILSLTLDHETRPIFETFLPQIADGRLPDGLHLRTAITIVGLSNSTVTGDIRFLNTNGQPLLLELDSGEQATWKPIASFSDNLTITRGNSEPAVAGYAKISSKAPITAVAAFQITNDNRVVLSETSVLSTPARFTHSGPVSEVAPKGMVGGGAPPPRYQTALAIANTAWEKNSVRISVTNQSPVEWELEAGEHKAAFIYELFPGVANQDFQGWLRISSSRPTVAVLLKTKDGLPVSAVPLESLEP